MDDTKAKNKRIVAEFRLKVIDVFFAAYGAFISGLFCIAQYFWGHLNYFIWIAASFFFLALLTIYLLSYSKKTATSENLLKYLQECANRVGVVSPIMLAFGFLLAVSADLGLLIVCIALEALLLFCYIYSLKKVVWRVNFGLLGKAYKWCKNNKPLLITVLFGVGSGICWLITSDELKVSDLCLNLLAGFISSGITIGVIDRIICKQQETRSVPLRKALYRDVQLFASRLIGLWREIYTQSTKIEDRKDLTAEELFNVENVIRMSGDLDLGGFPNVIPKQNWFTYIENERKDLVARGEKILETYINIAEPEIIQAIHFIINDSTYLAHLSHVSLIHSTDIIDKIPRPTLLAWHIMMPREMDYTMIKQLFSWCRNQFATLHDKENCDGIDIYPLSEEIKLINCKSDPTSLMSAEKKIALFDAFKKWQDSVSNKSSVE